MGGGGGGGEGAGVRAILELKKKIFMGFREQLST